MAMFDLISQESDRIETKLGKMYLDVKDIQLRTGLGKENTYILFKQKNFPTTKIGKTLCISS